MDQLTFVQIISVSLLPVLFAITVHEVAHGYVAYLLGDKTARVLGRLTLNPLKHIDIIGTVIVPIILVILGGVIIGWAKPVPINSRHFHKPKRDLALVAAAGPFANFLMLFIWAAIGKVGAILVQHNIPGMSAVYYMGKAGIEINIMLFILNLLPIPPLDGGHVLAGFLPKKLAIRYEQMAPIGFFVLLFLLAIGLLNVIINPAMTLFYSLIKSIFGL